MSGNFSHISLVKNYPHEKYVSCLLLIATEFLLSCIPLGYALSLSLFCSLNLAWYWFVKLFRCEKLSVKDQIIEGGLAVTISADRSACESDSTKHAVIIGVTIGILVFAIAALVLVYLYL
jgi:hypothetical protein